MLRPYAPNNSPRNYGIVQGSARLLERIWQPGAQYRPNPGAWGLFPHEDGRAVVGWLPDAQEALATYVRTMPEQAPERVASFDALRFINSEDEGFALIDGGATAYEVARVDVQRGLLVLESIETWARFQQLAPDGPAATSCELLPNDPGVLCTSAPQLRALGTPFPFPVAHDDGAGAPISIEWVLIFDRGSQRQTAADLLGPAALEDVPAAAGVPPYWPHTWSDQRYPWNTTPPYPQKWTASGPGTLRLFAKVITSPLDGTTNPAWRVKLAGRLRGFNQPAGPSGAAFVNVTTRN